MAATTPARMSPPAAAAPSSSLVDSIFGTSTQRSGSRNRKVESDNKKGKKKNKKGDVDDNDHHGHSLLASLFGATSKDDKGDHSSPAEKAKKTSDDAGDDGASQRQEEEEEDEDENPPSSSDDDEASETSSSSSSPSDDDDNNDDEPDEAVASSPGRKRKEGHGRNAALSSNEQTRMEEDPTPDDDDDHHPNDDKNDVEDRTVFVGNLPLGTTRKTLEAIFRGNGVCVGPKLDKVMSARIRRAPTLGVKLPPHKAGNQSLVQKVSANVGLFDPAKSSSCVGYVVFAHASTAERALELNNMEIPDPTAAATHDAPAMRHIRVDRVRPVHDASRSVFVGNLPHHKTDEETLRAHVMDACSFPHHSPDDQDEDEPIEAVRVVRDADFQCRGFAYILLRDKSLVSHVLQHLSDSTYMGRSLRVQVCGKRFKNRRGEAKPANPSTSASPTFRSDTKRRRHDDRGRSSAPSNRGNDAQPSPMGALRRIMATQAVSHQTKSRRARGPTAASQRSGRGGGGGGPGGGKSPAHVPTKRGASHAKGRERVKKIEKRLKRGMGKNKKSAAR